MNRHSAFLRISAGFWLLVIWFAVVNGLPLLKVILGAAAVHELGHWLALRVLGAKVLGIRIGILGAVMETDSHRLSYGRELAAVLAGPAANLLSAWLLTKLAAGQEVAVGAHLVLGAFNLLPIRPLDGGCALYLLSAWLLGPVRGEWIVRCAGVVVAFSLTAILAYLMWRTGGSLWLLPAMGGILLAAGRECF